MAVTASTTALVISTYVPPFAGVPTPTPTPTSNNNNPGVPPLSDGLEWITAYLQVHQLSSSSYRYAYILWLFILFFSLIFAYLHWTGFRFGFIGALFDKWAIRRRTWRKKRALKAQSAGSHKQPLSLASNAQLLALFCLAVGPLALCFAGPDYINPNTKVWDLTHNVTRRSWDMAGFARANVDNVVAPQFTIQKEWWTVGDRLGLIAFALFPLSVLLALKAPPFALFALPILTSLHFDKLTRLHKWCGRLIWLICAGHVVTWSVQLSKDKQDGVSGQSAWNFVLLYDDFIYAIVAFVSLTLLVIFSFRPFRDRFYETFYVTHIILVPTTLVFSALHYPPLSPWCYSALGLWVAERVYRFIRTARVNGSLGNEKIKEPAVVPGARYEPPSRLSKDREKERKRGSQDWEMRQRSGTPSGVLAGRDRPLPPPPNELPASGFEASTDRTPRPRPLSDNSFTDSISEYYQYDTQQEDEELRRREQARAIADGQWQGLPLDVSSPGSSVDLAGNNKARHSRQGSYDVIPGTATTTKMPPSFGYGAPVPPPSSTAHSFNPNQRQSPPAGYAHAVALPGHTVRLTLQTSRPLTWAPGQHLLLSVPAVSRFTTHPFTIASVCDKQGRSDIVLIIRARKGLTKKLWSLVQQRSGASRTLAETLFTSSGRPRRGILLKTSVDGPFGSSSRARWGAHSTVVIVVGGSGVSFGSSILEYLCMCLAGREGKTLGGQGGGFGHGTFKVDRVRFIWIVREYAHIQWCSPIIRRCLDMVPRNTVQVDIFVTNGTSKAITSTQSDLRALAYRSELFGDDESTLAPPVARFAKEGRPRSMSNSSTDSVDSAVSNDSQADLNYASDDGGRPSLSRRNSNETDESGHILDMTNFDYEDDTRMPGEAQLSQNVKKEGRVRRAMSRRALGVETSRKDLQIKSSDGTKFPAPPILQTPAPILSPIRPPPSSFRPPPVSYRQPAANYAPPPSPYGSSYPPPLSPFGPRSPSPVSDEGHKIYSSADYYAAGGDPLQALNAAQTPLRVPHASGSGPSTPTYERSHSSASDEWKPSAGDVSPGRDRSYPSLKRPWEEKKPWEESSPRPPNAKRSSTQSSLWTATTPLPYGGGLQYDPNFDSRTVGVGESTRSLVDRGGRPLRSGDARDEPPIAMDDDEVDDLHVVSEMARPGRPKLDQILADEVERSHGAIGVACCGPTSLNAMVRKIVAAQISPSRLLRGDRRGHISLVTEDFEW